MSEHEHNHEHGPNENVRMDILKVNHKIFSQYPLGSPERLACVRSKKLMELEAMTSAMNAMPADSVNLVSTMNAHLVIFALLRAGLCVGILAAIPYIWNWLGNTPGKMAIGSLTVLMVMLLADNISTAFRIYKERQIMLGAYKSLRMKFDALLDEIDHLNNP